MGGNEVGGIEVDFCVAGEASNRGQFSVKHIRRHQNEFYFAVCPDGVHKWAANVSI